MKKLKYLFLIMLAIFMSVTSVNAEVPSGERYSEFATNRTVLLTLFTTSSDVNLYAYTPRLNEFLNGSLSLVRYEDNFNDTYSNWAIRIYQSSRTAGNYTMNWVTEWIDSTTAQEFCSASSKPIPKGGETNSTVCNVVGNTAYLSVNYKLNTADTGTTYVDFELTANGISINWFLRLATAVYYPQIVESSYVDTETLTQQQQTIINQNQQQITQNNTIINQQQQTNDKLNEVLEQDKVCKNIDINNIQFDNKGLDLDGTEYNSSTQGVTNYINITKAKIKVLQTMTDANNFACYYDINKTLINCESTKNKSGQYMTIPTNATYFRATITKNVNKPQFEICQAGNQALNDNLNDVINQNNQAEETRKGIWETIKDLPNAFMNMLKSLFIPGDDYFETWFNDLKTFFEQKLGFLATPFTIFIDFINMYLDLDTTTDIVINIPDITVPNFENHKIISATTFNWSELLKSKESLNALWQLYLSFIDVYLILNFIGLCESKYNRIFGGDTSTYEYYTVEDSVSYDGQTGEVTSRRQNERRTTKRKV